MQNQNYLGYSPVKLDILSTSQVTKIEQKLKFSKIFQQNNLGRDYFTGILKLIFFIYWYCLIPDILSKLFN